MTHDQDDDKPAVVPNPDMMPTKELQRIQRQRDYERAKAERKAQRAADKQKARDEKTAIRSKKDEALWQALRPATALDDTKKGGSDSD